MYTSIFDLVKKARLAAASVMPDGVHQSYPIPVNRDLSPEIAFLYCRGMTRRKDEGYQLWAPSYVIHFSLREGKLRSLKNLLPEQAGEGSDEPIGRYPAPAERTSADFLEKEVLLYQAYDELTPCFVESSAKDGTKLHESAREFLAAFGTTSEECLLSYYNSIGASFFGWVGTVARAGGG